MAKRTSPAAGQRFRPWMTALGNPHTFLQKIKIGTRVLFGLYDVCTDDLLLHLKRKKKTNKLLRIKSFKKKKQRKIEKTETIQAMAEEEEDLAMDEVENQK